MVARMRRCISGAEATLEEVGPQEAGPVMRLGGEVFQLRQHANEFAAALLGYEEFGSF